MAFTPQQRQVLADSLNLFRRGQSESQQSIQYLFDLLLKDRPEQLAEISLWLASYRGFTAQALSDFDANALTNKAHLTRVITDVDALTEVVRPVEPPPPPGPEAVIG